MAFRGTLAALVFCHFKGTGTISINDSFNVASITDSGTGRYFVNYSTATAGINYSVNVGGYFDTSDSAGSTRPFPRRTALTTTQCGLLGASGESLTDMERMWCHVIADAH